MGNELNAVFTPTTQSLYGVSQPYAVGRRIDQRGRLRPSVAQALVEFPQYCNGLTGENENEGTSITIVPGEVWKTLSNGFYMEANYTYSA